MTNKNDKYGVAVSYVAPYKDGLKHDGDEAMHLAMVMKFKIVGF